MQNISSFSVWLLTDLLLPFITCPVTPLRLIQFLVHWEADHGEDEFLPEIRLPAAGRDPRQAPRYPLQRAGCGHPPHPSVQMPQCPRGDQKGTTNLLGFTLSLASTDLFSSWASPSALETGRKCGRATAAGTLITRGPRNPQPNVLSHTEAEVAAATPSPTSPLRHLRVSFEDNEPLNHCF